MMDTKINTQNNTEMTPVISLKGVNKWYGDFQALSNIDLEIRKSCKRSGRPRNREV